MPDQVRLEIDGRDVSVARGANLVAAVHATGAYVPHLCWEEGLEADGCCGLCTVGVQGESEPVLACETRVREGMVVNTSDRAAVAIRRRRLELIKADHANDCQLCPKNERCQLQEACRAAGVEIHVEKKLAYPADSDKSHPLFNLDRSRCILCGKCVKVCRDLQGLEGLEIAGRGFARRVRGVGGTDIGASICESCGQCVDRCPTASLLPKVFRVPTEEVRTVCPYCGVGCALHLELYHGQLSSVRAAADGAVNAGALCVKGRFGLTDVVSSMDRLERPQVRDNGAMRPASWDDALDLVAGRLKEHVDRGTFALLTSAKATTEENYLLQKFARVVMGTNNVDHSARLCHAPTVTGLADCFGSGAMTGTIDDIDRTGCVVVIGSNTTETHPVIGTRIRRAQRRGTPLVVIDPRRTDLAQRADVWLRPRPGSDVAVLAGLARVVIDESLVDRAFVEKRCVGYREFVSSLEEFTAPRVEALSGIVRDDIRDAARTIAKAKSAVFLFAMGLTQHVHGTDNVRALANLALLTGNVGRVGAGVAPLRGHNNVQGACDAGALPDVLPGYQRVDDPVARSDAAAIWGREPPAEPGLPLTEMWDAILDGRVRALWVVGENPCLADPDTAHVEEALRSLDLLVVQDLFLTETAGFAHVVLPAASFAEKDGTFTNTERRVQLVRKAVEPLGESRSDLEIVCALAQRMGAEGFAFDSAADVMDEMARLVPLYGGISHARLAKTPAGLQWPCPSADHPGTATLHEVAFARPHGKATFVPLRHSPVAEPVDEDYPFVLSTGRTLYHFHTGTMTRRVSGLSELRKEENVEVHPEDAARLGVGDGGPIRVTSRRGSVTARARVTDACPAGTVFMTFHFAESPTNRLTIGALDPESKIAELKICAVRVEPAGEDELAAPAAAAADDLDDLF
ncbi:MAG: formate dehydrogenase subunit alpha [Planctomycetota bacterium]|jgi:formate dehydrogenase alpha subunit